MCSLSVNKQPLVIQDVDKPLTYLNIYDAPHELPDTAIIHHLSPYWEVLHHCRGKFKDPGVFNGMRHRVRIKQPIPSYLSFGRLQISLKYDHQEGMCHHCNKPGHYAFSCTEKFCFNCESTGHQTPSCPQPCSICHAEDHTAKSCPFLWNCRITCITQTAVNQEVDIEGDPPSPSPSPEPTANEMELCNRCRQEPIRHQRRWLRSPVR